MLEMAKTAVDVHLLRAPPVLVIGTATDIPLADKSFDLVFSIGVVGQLVELTEHLADYLLTFCNPQGTLLLSVLAADNNPRQFRPATDGDIDRILSRYGQTSRRKISLPLPGHDLRETFHILTIQR
jgi:hypothetical protein